MGGAVGALDAGADDAEIFGILEWRIVGDFLPGSGLGEIAVGEGASAGGVNDFALLGAAGGWGDVPLFGGGGDQHLAGGGAGFAQGRVGADGASAAAGAQANALEVASGHGLLVLDLGPVGFEFFVQHHGEGGADALAHF